MGLLAFGFCCSWPSGAGVRSRAIQELAEFLARKAGQEASEEVIETLAARLERLALRFGDDGLIAAKKCGPQVEAILDEAGDAAPVAVRLLAQHGDDAVWIARRPEALKTISDVGPEAVEAFLKHKAVAQRLVAKHSRYAAAALKAIHPRNGRRLAMMLEAGDLGRIGRTDELLSVISRCGDRAMDFVWRNKGTLAIAAALTAFLADPEPFLDGTRHLVTVMGEAAVRPMAEVPGKLADGAAQRANWTLIILVCLGVASAFAWACWKRLNRPG